MELSGVGVWSMPLRYGDAGEIAEAAAELEELGFTALWIPDVGGPVFEALGVLRLGFSPDDIEHISDRLFDALIAWGDEEAISHRVLEHRAAGAVSPQCFTSPAA